MPKRAFAVLLSAFAVACAGGAPPPTTTASEPPVQNDEKAPEAENTSQLRASFMSECERAPERHEFCECSFDVVMKTLTREEITSNELAPRKQAQLKAGIVRECTGKLPESTIKKGFVVGCTSQGPGLAGFCGCTWTALRKSAEVGEIATMDTVQDPRAMTAAKSCMSEFPERKLESSLKSAFLEGCVKEPAFQKFCDCAWSTWRGQMTPLEMVLGGTESAKARSAFQKIKNACKALAPQRPPAG